MLPASSKHLTPHPSPIPSARRPFLYPITHPFTLMLVTLTLRAPIPIIISRRPRSLKNLRRRVRQTHPVPLLHSVEIASSFYHHKIRRVNLYVHLNPYKKSVHLSILLSARSALWSVCNAFSAGSKTLMILYFLEFERPSYQPSWY